MTPSFKFRNYGVAHFDHGDEKRQKSSLARARAYWKFPILILFAPFADQPRDSLFSIYYSKRRVMKHKRTAVMSAVTHRREVQPCWRREKFWTNNFCVQHDNWERCQTIKDKLAHDAGRRNNEGYISTMVASVFILLRIIPNPIFMTMASLTRLQV
jgi:hypothetical protein